MQKQNLMKTLFRGVLFTTLLILFYFMYMKTAIEQFTKGSTTIAQTPETLPKLEPPIFIFCPDPPFKPSFFKSHSVKSLGVEKYFWLFGYNFNTFENYSAFDLHMKMSHQLGSDWKILMIDVERYVLNEFNLKVI